MFSSHGVNGGDSPPRVVSVTRCHVTSNMPASRTFCWKNQIVIIFKKKLNNTMQPSGIYIYNRARAPAFLYNARRPWFVAMGCAQQPKCVALGLAKMNKSVKCQRQKQSGSFLFSLTAPSWRAPILWLAPEHGFSFQSLRGAGAIVLRTEITSTTPGGDKIYHQD